MSEIKEIRRDNLRKLATMSGGKQSTFALKLDMSAARLNHLLTGVRGIGEESARSIESRLHLPKYSLDKPLDVNNQASITISHKHDKPVMEHESSYLLHPGLIASRAGGFPLDEKLPLLDKLAVKKRRELANSKSDVKKAMNGDIEVTEFAYRYVAGGIGMEPSISDGDIVLVDPGIEPLESDCVLVEFDGGQTIMKLQSIGNESWLIYTHSSFASFTKPLSEAELLGVVLAVLPPARQLRRK